MKTLPARASLRVEALDQGRQQLLLLGRVGEGDGDGPLRGFRLTGAVAVAVAIAVATLKDQRRHDRDDGHRQYHELALLHSALASPAPGAPVAPILASRGARGYPPRCTGSHRG